MARVRATAAAIGPCSGAILRPTSTRNSIVDRGATRHRQLGGPTDSMAKRTRGSARPGQRRSASRSASRARPNTLDSTARPNELGRPATGLSPAEEARAAEIEAQILAEERAAQAGQRRAAERSREATLEPRGRTRDAVMIGARAAEEYAYVVRDVRRIVTIGGGLLIVLFALWLLIEVGHILTV
jgi:hypothetical protein